MALSAAAKKQIYATTLGYFVNDRRTKLGLSIPEAAELAGLSEWQWAALEYSVWVPQDMNLQRAIADTLQESWVQVFYWAAVSNYYQTH